jgi:iron complex transport system permease protein
LNIHIYRLALLALFVLLAAAASVLLGTVRIPWRTAIDAIWHFDGSRDQLIIRSVRLPRAVIALTVGASLALAGCMMQALSRNDLAGPELFGINYGAALAIVAVMFGAGSASLYTTALAALLGAGAAGGLVFLISMLGKEQMTPVKLVMAGATINLLLASITQGILIVNSQ